MEKKVDQSRSEEHKMCRASLQSILSISAKIIDERLGMLQPANNLCSISSTAVQVPVSIQYSSSHLGGRAIEKGGSCWHDFAWWAKRRARRRGSGAESASERAECDFSIAKERPHSQPHTARPSRAERGRVALVVLMSLEATRLRCKSMQWSWNCTCLGYQRRTSKHNIVRQHGHRFR